MIHMTRKTRISIAALLASALLIGALVFTSFVAPSRAQAASVGVSYETRGVWLAPNESNAFITAPCQTGMLLLGGGWTSGSKDVYVWRSIPWGTSGWMIGATNTHPSASQYVSAWATCATKLTGTATKVSSRIISVPGRTMTCAGNGAPTCGGGYIVSGGGFWSSSYKPTDLSLVSTGPQSGVLSHYNWDSCFYNPTLTTQTFTAYAVCTNLLPVTHYRWAVGSEPNSVPVGGVIQDDAYCFSGEKAISGGFKASLGLRFVSDWTTVRVFSNMVAGNYGTWRAKAYFDPGVLGPGIRSFARCFNPYY